MREVTRIDPRWLPELAAGYYRPPSQQQGQTNRDAGLKLKPIGGRDDWRLSRRRTVRVSQRF